jgi:hypothetical protein
MTSRGVKARVAYFSLEATIVISDTPSVLNHFDLDWKGGELLRTFVEVVAFFSGFEPSLKLGPIA